MLNTSKRRLTALAFCVGVCSFLVSLAVVGKETVSTEVGPVAEDRASCTGESNGCFFPSSCCTHAPVMEAPVRQVTCKLFTCQLSAANSLVQDWCRVRQMESRQTSVLMNRLSPYS